MCTCRKCRTKDAIRAAREALGLLDAALADVVLNLDELTDPDHKEDE